MRFYLLSPYPLPHHCAVLLHSDLLLGGVASTPSPISVCPNRRDRIHPEPGGWAWPCTDFSCILCERGRVQDTWSPAPPFTGAAALNFSLCLPSPRCQIAITSSWNCSVASLGSRFPGQAWECKRGEEISLGGLVLGKGSASHWRVRPCPALSRATPGSLVLTSEIQPHSTHTALSSVLTGGQNFTTHLLETRAALLAACFLSEIDSVSPL